MDENSRAMCLIVLIFGRDPVVDIIFMVSQDNTANIVAVPDVFNTFTEPWTDAESSVNWLKSSLPKDVKVGRVIAYTYEASVASFFGQDAPSRIQRMAETFAQELRADRKFAGTLGKPIIFICHGLGGVLLKKSLIYTSTRIAPKVAHLSDQFVSTFSILFFGTPHGKAEVSLWYDLERKVAKKSRNGVKSGSLPFLNPNDAVQGPQAVDMEFAPYMKRFRMFFFWERLPTSFKLRSELIVTPESAAPVIDNTESAGIHATHLSMAHFSSSTSSDYRTVIATLVEHCEKAPSLIAHRRAQADETLRQLRAAEAWELGGFGSDVNSLGMYRPQIKGDTNSAPSNFYPPKATTPPFVGRHAMLEKLEELFFPPECSTEFPGRKSCVIYGMSGCGKTELCSKFAEEFQHRYNAVFTIRAASSETISDSLGTIGGIAGLEPTEASGRHYLSQLKDPWLLIIDNADDRTLDLRSLIATGKSAHVLVTTQCPEFRRVGSLPSIQLEELTRGEAVELLLTTADIVQPWSKAIQKIANHISKLLGYLAIGVSHAGNCIFRGVCNLDEYPAFYMKERANYRNRKTAVDTDQKHSEEDDHVEATYVQFNISLNTLASRSAMIRQDSLDLLTLFSCFQFENIPVDIFTRAVDSRIRMHEQTHPKSLLGRFSQALGQRLQPPPTLPRFLCGEKNELDRYRIKKAISELRSCSLISFDGDYISMHPLRHAWASDSLSNKESATWHAIALNTLLLSVSLPNDGSVEPPAGFYRDVLPHLRMCLLKTSGMVPLPESLFARISFRVASLGVVPALIMRGQILNAAKCGRLLIESGHFYMAGEYLDNARKAAILLVGERHETVMLLTLALAKVYWGLSRPDEAIVLQKDVVASRTALLGDSDTSTLQAMDELGMSYWLHGLYTEALELQETTTRRMAAVMDECHPNYLQRLTALDNLGRTLGAWRRFEESRDIHQSVLSARRKLLPETHVDTLTAKANLAMALLDLGQLNDAKMYISEVYDERQKQLGKEHPWTLWALCYLAKVKIELGELATAETLLQQGIEAANRSLPEKHIGIAMGRGELAKVYSRKGDFAKARAMTEETIKIVEGSRGTAHPDYIYANLKMVHLCIGQGDIDSARKTARYAVEMVDMRLGREHPMGQEVVHMMEVLEDPASSRADYERLMPESLVASMASGPLRKGKAPAVSGSSSDHAPRRAPTW